MSNRKVAENWRLQTGRGKNASSMYYEGKTIYSYGSHFPMAYITGLEFGLKDIILQNSDSYSNSTAKHLGHMHSQCYNDATVQLPTDILKDLINEWEYRQQPTITTLTRAINAIETRIAGYELKKSRARKHQDTWRYMIEKDTKQLEILKAI